ncbi:MAG: rRNA maturation RNase YbeY [Clostridiales bacterium]|jgi:probable rRNA maturation factor|nr:rRNA maturation RNase YbeY [Clostridiales bacterium]
MDWEILVTNNADEDLGAYEDLARRFALAALATQSLRRGEVSVLFVNDAEMQSLNALHRNKDATTDVLAFPQYEADELARMGGEFVVLGDIIISIDKARAQAREYGHSLERELAFLTVHGILHLLGHDHDTPEGEREMFALQNEILRAPIP